MAMSRQHVTRTKKFSMIRLHSKQVVSTKTAQQTSLISSLDLVDLVDGPLLHEQGRNIVDHGRRVKVGSWKAGQGWSRAPLRWVTADYGGHRHGPPLPSPFPAFLAKSKPCSRAHAQHYRLDVLNPIDQRVLIHPRLRLESDVLAQSEHE